MVLYNWLISFESRHGLKNFTVEAIVIHNPSESNGVWSRSKNGALEVV